LQPEEAAELNRRAHAPTASARDRQRAEIILLGAQGLTQQCIAGQIGNIAAGGEPLGWALCGGPVGRAGRSCRPRAQTVAAGGCGAASDGASGDRAVSSGSVELPHNGPCGGQRATAVGGQRHQARVSGILC